MDVLFARFQLTGAYTLDDSHFTAAGNGSFLPVTQHVGTVGSGYHSAGVPETPFLFAVSLCGLCAAFCPFVVQALNKNYNGAQLIQGACTRCQLKHVDYFVLESQYFQLIDPCPLRKEKDIFNNAK